MVLLKDVDTSCAARDRRSLRRSIFTVPIPGSFRLSRAIVDCSRRRSQQKTISSPVAIVMHSSVPISSRMVDIRQSGWRPGDYTALVRLLSEEVRKMSRKSRRQSLSYVLAAVPLFILRFNCKKYSPQVIQSTI